MVTAMRVKRRTASQLPCAAGGDSAALHVACSINSQAVAEDAKPYEDVPCKVLNIP
jgi:hypothetical protein